MYERHEDSIYLLQDELLPSGYGHEPDGLAVSLHHIP